MRHLIFGAIVLMMPVAASAAVIDFDDLDASPTQTVPLPDFTEDGFTFSVSVEGNAQTPGVAVFDTTCTGAACNGDTDLVPAAQAENGIEGNILILQERPRNGVPAATPDDDFSGGTFVLTLISGPSFFFTGASAIDDTTFDFGTRINGTDTYLDSITLTTNSQTGMTTFMSDQVNVGDSILVRSFGSGGFDSLVLAPVVPAVPVPAALPLMLAGIAGFGVVARRRKPNAA